MMELLSPAGSPEVALAAFDGGADAVYCGLSRFNARERAENFTDDSLGRLVRYAHEHGKKVYVTLNTLIKESELREVFELLCRLRRISPDALIVQDPGVICLVRSYFPELTLHGSTQMGIHNSAGVAMASRLGLRRVILERQVTLDELAEIAGKSSIELEVFIHGSLCCSLSGRCLLSSFLGNWSGNRGKCKQPCRREYFTDKGSGFLLSPRDLCGVTLVDTLAGYGIASLKIEGRLRSPDYVWKSARAYRTLLDSTPETRQDAVMEAEKLIASAASRKSSAGFYFASGWSKLIDKERFGAFGNVVARVERVTGTGISVAVTDSLHLGDRLRLAPADGGEGESFSLAAMYPAGQHGSEKLLRCRSGKKVFIPGQFSAAAGYLLCKIGENGFDFSRMAAALPPLRYALGLRISCQSKRFCAELEFGSGKICWSADVDFAPAETRPLTAEDVAKVFASGSPELWHTPQCQVEIENGIFVPAGELKSLRRRFWNDVLPQLSLPGYFPEIAGAMERFYQEYSRPGAGSLLPALTPQSDAWEFPAFVPETEVSHVMEQMRQAYRAGCREFRVTGLHALEMARQLPGDARLVSRFPLPVTNSAAVKLLQQCGVCAAEASPELEDSAVAALASGAIAGVHEPQQDIPLLATRVPLPGGVWKDRRKNSFRVVRKGGLSLLFSDGVAAREHFADSELK